MFTEYAVSRTADAIVHALRRRRNRRLVALAFLLLILTLLATWVAPLLYTPDVTRILADDAAARRAVQEGREAGLRVVAIPLTPLASAYVRLRSYSGDGPSLESVGFRWDNAVLIVGALFVMALLMREVGASFVRGERLVRPSDVAADDDNGEPMESRIESTYVTEVEDPTVLPPAKQQETPKAVSSPPSIARATEARRENTTADSVLRDDVNRAVEIAVGLYSRSTLLLGGGIAMAFVGIGVFWAALPAVPKTTGSAEQTILAYLPLTIRPLAMLIFVEAIAWFLLRQYRALIEDYKSFHKLYVRRVNFLAAFTIASRDSPTAAELSVAAALLADDVAARLKTGETTENLQGIQQIDPNPVVTLFSAVINRAADVAAVAAKREPPSAS
jgi:hypothetical protein